MKTYYDDDVTVKKFIVSGKRGFVATELNIKTIGSEEAFCVLTDDQCRKLAAMLLKRLPKKTARKVKR